MTGWNLFKSMNVHRRFKRRPSLLDLGKREVELARLEIRQGRLQRTMAVLAGFSAVVSGFEAYMQHTRGAFSNRWMWTPVLLTPPMLLAAAATVISQRAARLFLPITSAASIVNGVIGFLLHVRGIRRMPGGVKIGQYNLVMGPPLFAPLLVTIVGILGLLATLLKREKLDKNFGFPTRSFNRQPKIQNRNSQIPLQRALALSSALLGVLAGGEAYLEHLRGSYNERIMWTPVWVTPPMVAAAVGSAVSERVARLVLPITSFITFADGLLGFVLHLRGIKRMPGSFENLEFNLTMGPPLFAPLLFSAVGLLGMVAVLMRKKS